MRACFLLIHAFTYKVFTGGTGWEENVWAMVFERPDTQTQTLFYFLAAWLTSLRPIFSTGKSEKEGIFQGPIQDNGKGNPERKGRGLLTELPRGTGGLRSPVRPCVPLPSSCSSLPTAPKDPDVQGGSRAKWEELEVWFRGTRIQRYHL